MEGNDHLGHVLVYFDSEKHYPGAASWGNGGAALKHHEFSKTHTHTEKELRESSHRIIHLQFLK